MCTLLSSTSTFFLTCHPVIVTGQTNHCEWKRDWIFFFPPSRERTRNCLRSDDREFSPFGAIPARTTQEVGVHERQLRLPVLSRGDDDRRGWCLSRACWWAPCPYVHTLSCVRVATAKCEAWVYVWMKREHALTHTRRGTKPAQCDVVVAAA